MNVYLVFILSAILGSYLLAVLVDWLNIKNIATELPEEFRDYYDAEKYSKSQSYLRENSRFGLIVGTLQTTAEVGMILFGGFNLADRFARSFELGSIATGLLFVGVLLLASSLLSLPFSIYSTFVVEEKYGFNRTTVKTFILDFLKSLLLGSIIGGAVLAGVLWFFEQTGEWAWLYCWLGVSGFQVVLMFIAPFVIMPLFNRFEPLEDGELKSAIEEYALTQKFKMKGVYKMDGSRRSSKSNAFFTGFGSSRRIVLFDTLIKKHSTSELVSIVAHEMGHYKKGHILQALVRGVVMMGFSFFLMSLFINNEQLFAAFQMEHLSIYASLLFFGFLYSPLSMVLSIVQGVISRKHEYDADAYAVRTFGAAEDMISALKKLSVDNLSNLSPHPLKVVLSYSHPPVLERILAIRKLSDPK